MSQQPLFTSQHSASTKQHSLEPSQHGKPRSQHSGRLPESQQVAPTEQHARPNWQQSEDLPLVEAKDTTTNPSDRTEAVTIFVNMVFSSESGRSDCAFT
jgi:hypothetical protein